MLVLSLDPVFSIERALLALAVVCGVWIGTLVTYRLYLGPLAQFPGDKLAALTGFYETYFDCVKSGRYWVEIQRMHEEYGMPSQSVRISKAQNPGEGR
jgi:hypothetical protein